jgi:hypothetical protein
MLHDTEALVLCDSSGTAATAADLMCVIHKTASP